MKELSDIGLVGLAVMGENLVLNMESKGFRVSVFNRTVEKVDKFMEGRGKGKNIYGAHSLEDFIATGTRLMHTLTEPLLLRPSGSVIVRSLV